MPNLCKLHVRIIEFHCIRSSSKKSTDLDYVLNKTGLSFSSLFHVSSG